MSDAIEAALTVGVDAGMKTAAALKSREMMHKFSDDYFAMAVSQDAVRAAITAYEAAKGGDGEAELFAEENADNLRLTDWISDKIGLPHDEELSQLNFGAWLSGLGAKPSEEEIADGALDAGINYAIERLCEILDVDPKSISWDAATETMDGDVSSVICNAIRAAYGEDWSSKAEDTARIRSALTSPVSGERDEWPKVTDVMAEPVGTEVVLVLTANGDGLSAILDAEYAALLRDKLAAALSEIAPEAKPAPVGVKPLEWRETKKRRTIWQGRGAMGHLAYVSNYDQDGIEVDGFLWMDECFNTLDAAKAAAQADYEARIRSALTSPASGELDADLTTRMQRSIAAFAKLSPDEQDAHMKLQRESWVRGETGIGSDEDEAEARAAYRVKASGERAALIEALKKYDLAAEWHSCRPHDVGRKEDLHHAAVVLAEAVRAALRMEGK